jgi:site-specific DNA recombinase
MKAAIYARTATKEQSTTNQLQYCREYVLEQQGKVVGVYDDEGINGNVLDRDGLKVMMKDAVERKFDTIIVVSFDRLTRNPLRLLKLIADLKASGIEVKTVSS